MAKCTDNSEVKGYLREILVHLITIEGVMGEVLNISAEKYGEAMRRTREEMEKNGI